MRALAVWWEFGCCVHQPPSAAPPGPVAHANDATGGVFLFLSHARTRCACFSSSFAHVRKPPAPAHRSMTREDDPNPNATQWHDTTRNTAKRSTQMMRFSPLAIHTLARASLLYICLLLPYCLSGYTKYKTHKWTERNNRKERNTKHL